MDQTDATVHHQFYRLLNENYDAINDRKRFVSLLKDLLPGMIIKQNLLLNLYDIGIYKEIVNVKNIDNTFIFRFVKRLHDDYGVSSDNAQWAVDTWCICLGGILGKYIEGASESKQCEKRDSENSDNSEIAKKTNIASDTITTTALKSTDDKLNDLHRVYEYDIINSGVIIKKYVAFDTDEVTVPDLIEGYPVVEIGESAFEKCGIKHIYLPYSIIRVGSSAFRNSKIEIIRLSPSIVEISKMAFAWCYNLKQIYLPSSLLSIGAGAFGATGISRITIPENIHMISSNAFCACESLCNVVLPKNLKEIDNFAFADSYKLHKVDIPTGTRKIGAKAFIASSSEDRGLIHIRIPDSVVEFGGVITMYEYYKNGNIKREWDEFSDNAFGDGSYISNNMTIYCNPGSEAIKYARQKGIKFDKYENYHEYDPLRPSDYLRDLRSV